MTLWKLTIARRFAADREDRDLPNGAGHWTSRGYATVMTDDELAELRSDADFYADTIGMDFDGMAQLAQSARATMRAINAAKKEND